MPDPSPTQIRSRRWIVAFIVIPIFTGLAWLAWHNLRESRSPDDAAEPHLPDPVDVASVGRIPVNPEDNAFEYYRQASTLLQAMSAKASSQFQDPALEGGWQFVETDLRVWLEQNRPALKVFLAGSECNEAVYWQPADLTLTSDMDVLQKMRDMIRLAQLEGLRMSDAGDFGGAWLWYRAMIRASRHAGLHGAVMERLFGHAFHAVALQQIVRWAANPAVDSEMLRVALDETRSIYKQTAAVSTTLQIEYVMVMKTMQDRSMAAELAKDGFHLGGVGDADVQSLLRRFNEPETSIRVARLAFSNWLSQCDLPRPLRAGTTTGKLGLFDPGPLSRSPESAPDAIERLLERTVLAKQMLPGVNLYIVSDDREHAKQGLLEMALALQCIYREQGAFPNTIHALADTYFAPLPVDPFGRGEAIHYRLEPNIDEGVTLWSIGPDATDDDGKIDFRTTGDYSGDMIVHVRPPRRKGD